MAEKEVSEVSGDRLLTASSLGSGDVNDPSIKVDVFLADIQYLRLLHGGFQGDDDERMDVWVLIHCSAGNQTPCLIWSQADKSATVFLEAFDSRWATVALTRDGRTQRQIVRDLKDEGIVRSLGSVNSLIQQAKKDKKL